MITTTNILVPAMVLVLWTLFIWLWMVVGRVKAVSATGQIAGGANLICFTTGRGSMFGAKPVPSIKIATNTPMYMRLTEDMDVNAGVILDGEATLEETGELIFRKMLETASGTRTKSEELGLGDNEFVPWSIGIMS